MTESPENSRSSASDLLVIIPVHNARDPLLRCLESLDHHTPDARVLLIDDASTDTGLRPLMKRWTDAVSSRQLIALDDNIGFVRSANLGANQDQSDIVLLNSDTVVTPGWLDALHRCLGSDKSIATATPWSNNGEIVSVPGFCQPNPVPAAPDEMARAAVRVKSPGYPDIPTGVGFCMAVSRRAINEIGLFDPETFGRGYGEENDFCRRAVGNGFRNVLCDDAYVVHEGGRSFAPLGLSPGSESMQRLLGKHPGYHELISGWIARDPLRERRENLVAACDASE